MTEPHPQNESLEDLGADGIDKNSNDILDSMAGRRIGQGRGIFGIPIAWQRGLIWLLAIVFLYYSYTQNQILAGFLGLVVAYVINRR
jgi:hypothetical protein